MSNVNSVVWINQLWPQFIICYCEQLIFLLKLDFHSTFRVQQLVAREKCRVFYIIDDDNHLCWNLLLIVLFAHRFVAAFIWFSTCLFISFVSITIILFNLFRCNFSFDLSLKNYLLYQVWLSIVCIYFVKPLWFCISPVWILKYYYCICP